MKTFIFAVRVFLRPLCDTLAFIWIMSFVLVYLSGCASTPGYNPWAHVGDGLVQTSQQNSPAPKQVFCTSYQASGQTYTTCQ